MSCPSSLTVLECAQKSPQPHWQWGVWVSSPASLCMLVFQSASAFSPISSCPFTFLPAHHRCGLLSAGWIFSATHRAEPLRKTNISLFLLASLLRVSPGVSFHKANNVRLYHSKVPRPPPLHSYLPLFPLYLVKEPTTISSKHKVLQKYTK